MADEPAKVKEKEDAPQIVVSSGVLALVTPLARIAANLSTDKALTLFVCAGFGWLLFETMKSNSDDKAAQVRQTEDARERDRLFYTQQRAIDRRHCDEREDKFRQDKAADDDKMRVFFAAELEKFRVAIAKRGAP